MKRLDRLKEIHALLDERGSITTDALAVALKVSVSTVRRDIVSLSRLPQFRDIQRVHGGVLLDRPEVELPFDAKRTVNRDLKLPLARAAVSYIFDGDSLIIDSGTTCLLLAQLLSDRRDLRVVTTDLKIAEELGRHEGIESNVVGGTIRAGYYTIGGSVALSNLDLFSLDKVFMSADALDLDHGITNSSEFEVGVKKRLFERGKRIHVLADSTKLGRHALYRVADLAAVDVIFTNGDIDPGVASAIRRIGIDLVIVGR